MLVTAVALFFSTFSSPFLSAGLTVGLWVIGHFNADLRNFEAVVESPELVNQDPYGESWLIRVRLDDPASANALMDADAYRAHLKTL